MIAIRRPSKPPSIIPAKPNKAVIAAAGLNFLCGGSSHFPLIEPVFTLVHGCIPMMSSAPILRSPEFPATKCLDQGHL